MSEEKDHFYRDSEFLELVRRYEEMISNSTRYYFDVDEFEDIIDHYINLGKLNHAHKATLHALRQHPASTSIQLKKSLILNEKGQPLESLRTLRAIEKIEVNNPEVCFAKGIALSQLGKLKDAVRQFNRAVELTDDGKADLLFNIGVNFEQQNNFPEALGFLLQAYDMEPENVSYIYDVAFCYERLYQADKALDFYNRSLDIDPFSENVWYNIGVVYNRLEEYEKAIEAYDFAISLDNEFASAYFNKANTLANSGKFRQAIEVYMELLYLEDDNEQVVCYIGECHEKLEEWDEAMNYYGKALEINQEYGDAWLGEGMVLFAMGKHYESLYNVEKAISYSPDNPQYWYALGNIWSKLDRRADAINAYRKAVDLDSEDTESWINLSEAYLANKEKAKAIEILEDAVRSNPGSAVINYRLAAYCLITNDAERAYEYLRIALGLDFDMHREFFAYYPRAAKIKAVLNLIEQYRGK